MQASAAAQAPPVAAGGETWAPWVAWANGVPSFRDSGLRCLSVESGGAVLTLAQSPWSPNPNGAVNGGLVIAAADQCMGLVALTTLDPGALPATATLHAEFLRPAFAPLTFRASVAQRGNRLVFVSVDVENATGRLCVRCTGTMAMESGPAAGQPAGPYRPS
jgi:uncharacterized protein (TIGR00369 family)